MPEKWSDVGADVFGDIEKTRDSLAELVLNIVETGRLQECSVICTKKGDLIVSKIELTVEKNEPVVKLTIPANGGQVKVVGKVDKE